MVKEYAQKYRLFLFTFNYQYYRFKHKLHNFKYTKTRPAKSLFSGELVGSQTTSRTAWLGLCCLLPKRKVSGGVKSSEHKFLHHKYSLLNSMSWHLLVSVAEIQHPASSGLKNPLPPPSVEGWAPEPWPHIPEMSPFPVIHTLWSQRMPMKRRAVRREGHGHSESVWWKHGSSRHHLRGHVWHVWRWEEWR